MLEIFPIIDTYAEKSDIPVEIIFAQMCLESSYGIDEITENANNYFGIKGVGPEGSYNTLTDEHIDGDDVKIKDNFRKYSSMNQSIEDYVNLLNKNYRKHVTTGTPEDWAKALVKGGYATAPNYEEVILNIAEYWRLL